MSYFYEIRAGGTAFIVTILQFGVPLDKNEGVVKAQLYGPVNLGTA